MIYLIGNRDAMICKIGKSSNPIARLRTIQTGSPYKLEIIYTLDVEDEVELDLHEMFDEYRLQGEWFVLNDEIMQEFAGLIKSNKDFINSGNSIVKKTPKINKAAMLKNGCTQMEIDILSELQCQQGHWGIIHNNQHVRNSFANYNNNQVKNVFSNLSKKGVLITACRGAFKVNEKYLRKV